MTTKTSKAMLDTDVLVMPDGTTKGDLAVYTGAAWIRVGVGTNGQSIVADSTQASGVKWATPGASDYPFIGQVMAHAGGSPVPPRSLPCDGAAVSRTTYSALFGIIGTNYGIGDGSTTFNVPDMRGRTVIGTGTGTASFGISSVNTGTDELTVPSNDQLTTGTPVVYTSSGSAITGLTSGNTYYIVRVSATLVKLASLIENAAAGIVIDLTSAGSGTQTLVVTLTARTIARIGGEETHLIRMGELLRRSSGSATFSAVATETANVPFPQVGAAVMQPYVPMAFYIYAGA